MFIWAYIFLRQNRQWPKSVKKTMKIFDTKFILQNISVMDFPNENQYSHYFWSQTFLVILAKMYYSLLFCFRYIFFFCLLLFHSCFFVSILFRSPSLPPALLIIIIWAIFSIEIAFKIIGLLYILFQFRSFIRNSFSQIFEWARQTNKKSHQTHIRL